MSRLSGLTGNKHYAKFCISRPKSLKDVTAQDHTITVLQRTLQASNVFFSSFAYHV